MPQTPHADLLEDALKLPPDDRLALATELLHSVEDRSAPEWERAWSAEIDRRIQELDDGRVKAIPWSEVRDRLLERYASK